MSRTYALALIFTAVAVIASLFYLQHHLLTERNEAMLAYAEGVHERAIALKQEHLDEMVNALSDQLMDEARARFRPMRPLIEEARTGEQKLIDRAAALREGTAGELRQLLELRNDLLLELINATKHFLSQYGKQMDLSDAEVSTKTTLLEKYIADILRQPVGGFSTSSFSQQRDLMVLDYLSVVEVVVNDVRNIAGGKVISCHFGPEFFPLVVTGFLNPQRGEKISTRLSIGSYSTALNPEYVTIVIGGDSLKPNAAGFIDYDFIAQRRGRQELNMELFIQNPLTGEVSTQGTTSYQYFVR